MQVSAPAQSIVFESASCNPHLLHHCAIAHSTPYQLVMIPYAVLLALPKLYKP